MTGPNLIEAEVCIECGKLEIAHDDPYAERCEKCFAEHEQNRAEAAYEDSLGECFRGNQASAYEAEQMDFIRRNFK